MINNSIVEREKEIKVLTGKNILSISEVAEYLGVSIEIAIHLSNNGSIKPIGNNCNLFLPIDVARFVLDTKNDSMNGYVENSYEAVESMKLITEDIDEENFNMTVHTYGEGSIYWNQKRECYQMAFYMDINGNKQRKIVSGATEQEVITKKGAAIALANANVQSTSQAQIIVVQGNSNKSNITVKTISEVADEWLNVYKGSVKAASYEHSFYMIKHIKKYFNDKIISELTPTQIELFLNHIARPDDGKNQMSQKLIGSVKTTLGQLIKFGIRSKYLFDNPMVDIKVPVGKKTNKDSKFLNQEQLAEIFETLKDSKKYTTLINLLLMSGLRIEEALALE